MSTNMRSQPVSNTTAISTYPQERHTKVLAMQIAHVHVQPHGRRETNLPNMPRPIRRPITNAARHQPEAVQLVSGSSRSRLKRLCLHTRKSEAFRQTPTGSAKRRGEGSAINQAIFSCKARSQSLIGRKWLARDGVLLEVAAAMPQL